MIDGTAPNLTDEGRARVMQTMSWFQPTKAWHPFPPPPLALIPETTAALRTVLLPRAGLPQPVERMIAATPGPYARIIALVGLAPIIDTFLVIAHPPPGGTDLAESDLPPVPHPFALSPRFLAKPRRLTRLSSFPLGAFLREL
jgi:hypothetical protein